MSSPPAPSEEPRSWALLASEKGSARTSLLREVVARLRARGVRVGGVLQDVLVESEETEERRERTGYVARALADDACEVLAARARAGDEADKQLVCTFAFDPAALARVRAWIERDARQADVVVIDEVSKLEAARGGHHDAIASALDGPALPLLSVRADQLFRVMERFGLDEPVAALESGEPAELARFVERIASFRRGGAR